jgi:formate dehydrogenase subunit beta
MRVNRLVSVQAGDPLGSLRALLALFWAHSQWDGLLIPTWSQEAEAPRPALLTDPQAIDEADPFAPVMLVNAASRAAQAMEDNPSSKLAFMLRPCELRSLRLLATRRGLDLSPHLTISADCLAAFPREDFQWRLEKALGRDHLTREALHFAAQGGILPSRYRSSCQTCEQPYPVSADVSIKLMGLETSDHYIVELRDSHLASELGMDQVSRQEPSKSEIERRQRTLDRLIGWRQQTLDYAASHMDRRHKSVEGLLEHLNACESCRSQIEEVCPLFDAGWLRLRGEQEVVEIERWLRSCAGCGMCAYQCPQGFPLYASISFLSDRLRERAL